MNRNDELPVGYLLKRAEGDIYFEAKWRDSCGTQRKRRLGKAWLVKTEDGYERRRGRVRPGYLDERRAHIEMSKVIDEHEEDVSRAAHRKRERQPLVASLGILLEPKRGDAFAPQLREVQAAESGPEVMILEARAIVRGLGLPLGIPNRAQHALQRPLRLVEHAVIV